MIQSTCPYTKILKGLLLNDYATERVIVNIARQTPTLQIAAYT